jgi:Bacterial membrane protein YfhO
MFEESQRYRSLFLVCAGFAAFFAAFFAPVLVSGKLMASADALTQSIPAYLGPHHLWEPLILLGHPMYADPIQMYWYPLAWLRIIPGTYNIFAIAPFWLAAVGTFGLVRALTRSTLGALIAGLGFALGGFMIAHAGHLTMTHPAAWSPFALWSLEEMRRDARRRWFVLLALAIALCAFGQPQVLAFALAVCLLYALVSSGRAPAGRWTYLTKCGLGALLGLGVAAVGLVPEALLAHESLRSTLSFAQFVTFSTPPGELWLRLTFPYFSPLLAKFTELTDFVGLGVLTLSVLALLSRDSDRRVWFWAAVAFAALALSTGDALGLAGLTYHVPVYDLFRIPGRHAFEFTLAAAILAGYGTAALQRGAGVGRCAVAVAAIGTLLAVALATIARSGQVNPIGDSTLAPGLCAYIVIGIALLAWSMRPKSLILGTFVLAAVVGELVFFGEQAYWRTTACDAAAVRAPAAATDLANALASGGGRALWAPGINGGSLMSPNLSLLWGVPVVSGYTSLAIARVAHLLGLAGDMTVSYDASLDLAGTRFILAPAQEQSSKPAGDPFGGTDLGVFIGDAALAPVGSVTLGTERPVRADRIAMISQLTVATAIPDRARVAWLRIVDIGGHVTNRAILAGRDTAEMAYDRPEVGGRVRHRRAAIASSNDGYHTYSATFATNLTEPIDHVTIVWAYPSVSALRVIQLALIDDRAGVSYPMGSLSQVYGERSRFRARATDGGIAIFQNTHAFPRAWIVRRLEYASADDAFLAIHRGITPAGRPFDPRVSAFVDDRSVRPHLSGGSVSVTPFADGSLRMVTACSGPCFVISSDAWYPGWQARIDGKPAPLVRSDGALRGLLVPAGRHVIRERFVPLDLLLGAVCSTIALAAIAAKVLWLW